MSTEMSDEEIRRLATRRVRRKRRFFSHLTVYLIVNAFLWCMWALSTSGIAAAYGWGMMRGTAFPWPVFVSVFWGIGLVSHGLGVFAFHSGWEQKEIDKEIEQLKKGKG
jgi:uncharacterized protein (DUF486 family)